jgi:hypothetical protein
MTFASVRQRIASEFEGLWGNPHGSRHSFAKMADECGDRDGVAGPSAEKRRRTAKDFPNFVTTDVNEVLRMLDDDDLYGSDLGSEFDDSESSDSEATDSIVRACGDVVLPSVLRRQAEREERAEMDAQYSDRLPQSDDSEYDPNDDSNPDYDSDGSTTSAASQVLFATLPGLPTQTVQDASTASTCTPGKCIIFTSFMYEG